jgi:hypothetical protein
MYENRIIKPDSYDQRTLSSRLWLGLYFYVGHGSRIPEKRMTIQYHTPTFYKVSSKPLSNRQIQRVIDTPNMLLNKKEFDSNCRVIPKNLDINQRKLHSGYGDTARVFFIDGNFISNKEQFLKNIADTLQFPSYFGYNWDAFEECMTDLDWLHAEKFCLAYESPEKFALSDPGQWEIAWDILLSAVEYWKNTQKEMILITIQGGKLEYHGKKSNPE